MPEKFLELPQTPIDPIMIANSKWPSFQQEHLDAINTTIGVLIDPETTKPWRPKAVVESQQEALELTNDSKDYGYQTQSGNQAFLEEAAKIVFGEGPYLRRSGDLIAYQASGGTGALSLAKDTLLSLRKPEADGSIPLVLDSGWPNHPAIFTSPFAVTTYNHLLPGGEGYNHQASLDAVIASPDSSIVLLQTCGYNDDGADRNHSQWDEILDAAQSKESIVILDSAYLGLADGFELDRYPIEQSLARGLLTFVCVSNSKNMGLYNERLGALFIANASQNLGDQPAKNLDQLIARIVRRTVSTPSLLAAKTASLALGKAEYHNELKQARQRLALNRQAFAFVVDEEFPGIGSGLGIFTKLLPGGFSERQQSFLESEGILTLPNSRINLGGLRLDQVEKVGTAILRALHQKTSLLM